MSEIKTEVLTDSASNSVASVSATANAGESIFVNSLTVSYDSAPSTATCVIKSDGVAIWTIDDNSEDPKHFNWAPTGLKLPAGEDLTIELSAGGSGITGHINTTIFRGE